MVSPLRIGPLLIDPPLLSAPMAGFSNYAYRQILRRLGGVGMPATEMISARSFIHIDHEESRFYERLWGVVEEPRPLAVQIWDNDPAAMAAVGRRLAREFRISVVDINFGCPTRDVAEKAKSGSYLLRYPDRIGEIVAQVVKACEPTPVTAKIRLGCTRDTINAKDVAQAIEGAGAAAVTVHGRTAADGFRGTADWEQIVEIKPHLKRISLIGNGDLKTPQEVAQAFSRYGVDGVMIGREGLSRPWLFRQAQAALAAEPIPPDPDWAQQRQLLIDHYRLVVEQHGPIKGTILMRAISCQYVKGSPGIRTFRNLVARATSPEEFYGAIENGFPRE